MIHVSPFPSLVQAVPGEGKPLTSQPSLAVLPTSTISSDLTALTSGPTKSKMSISTQFRHVTYK